MRASIITSSMLIFVNELPLSSIRSDEYDIADDGSMPNTYANKVILARSQGFPAGSCNSKSTPLWTYIHLRQQSYCFNCDPVQKAEAMTFANVSERSIVQSAWSADHPLLTRTSTNRSPVSMSTAVANVLLTEKKTRYVHGMSNLGTPSSRIFAAYDHPSS